MNRILIILTFLLLLTALYAQPPKVAIAVLELDPTGISPADAQFLSDRLRTELFETGAFTVVEREKMNELLDEQGFQSSGCTTVDCAVQIGRLLNVQQIAAGSIGKIDDLFSISIRLIDIQSGALVKTATRDYEGKLSEVLVDVIPEVAGVLAAADTRTDDAQTDTRAAASSRNFAVVLKYGWAFLNYVDELNDQIDNLAAAGNEVRPSNFPQHTAFAIEGRYELSEDWRLKAGVVLQSMASEWLNQFDRFQSEIPEIKNLTDITLERRYSFAHAYLGLDYIFWQPSANQEWYLGADVGTLAMESYMRHEYTQDLIPRSEEFTGSYNKFILRFSAGFSYLLSDAFFIGLEAGVQAVSKFDLTGEQKPANFPPGLVPVVFPQEISASGGLLQLTAGYRF